MTLHINTMVTETATEPSSTYLKNGLKVEIDAIPESELSTGSPCD